MREFPDKKVRWHGYIESDLDTLFVREYAKVPVQEYRCPVREQDFDLHEISDLMRRVCAKFPVPRFTEEEFGRGVRRYFRFEKMLTDKRFRRRKVIFRMETDPASSQSDLLSFPPRGDGRTAERSNELEKSLRA